REDDRHRLRESARRGADQRRDEVLVHQERLHGHDAAVLPDRDRPARARHADGAGGHRRAGLRLCRLPADCEGDQPDPRQQAGALGAAVDLRAAACLPGGDLPKWLVGEATANLAYTAAPDVGAYFAKSAQYGLSHADALSPFAGVAWGNILLAVKL